MYGDHLLHRSVIPVDADTACQLIESDRKKCFLLVGKAGTGKSWTIDRLYERDIGGTTVVLAPTGIAAQNCGGQTIHSFFRLKPSVITDEDIEASVRNESIRDTCIRLSRIIIDEVSMVRCDVLDAIDRILRGIREKNLPFGGVQFVLVGDPFQLPPVTPNKEKHVLKSMGYASFFFFGAQVFPRLDVEILNFTKVYRQQDESFINLLDRARKGRLLGHDYAVLQRRSGHTLSEIPAVPTILTTKNATADRYNESEFKRIHSEPFTFTATIEGNYEHKNITTTPLKLTLKVGARVMVTKNGAGKQWFNGDLGTITDYDDGSVFVRLDRTRDVVRIVPDTWESYAFYYDRSIGKIRRWVTGTMTQIPLRLGWAMTIHKSQGLTLTNVYIDTDRHVWDPGQLYVAMSRCTSLDGLYFQSTPHRGQFLVHEDLRGIAW